MSPKGEPDTKADGPTDCRSQHELKLKLNTGPRDSCREVISKMEIMKYSQYIYSLLLFIINNTYLFNTNNEIHKYKTRIYNNLHLPLWI
jgi:hypothetical protein